MSDDDDRSDSGSGSGSESEDLSTTGLIATRAKRSTAGNLYTHLRANLDIEELQKQLGADGLEDDVEDYEGGEGDDDDDAAFDSSSDEDDAGPPKDGEAEDLSGEKEVKKAERAEAKKKRKTKDARLVVPAWQKKKKVKIAEDVKTDDSAADNKPKKKSERSNWMPTPADMPTRQSDRSLARANREITHAHLKQSALRSEKQRKVMENAAKREKTHKREELTQEERLAFALRIEKQTKKEFGRWERDEKERQRIRDEQLAAKRRKVIHGPIIRYWSGSAMWEGDALKVKRVMSEKQISVEEARKEAELAVAPEMEQLYEPPPAPKEDGNTETAAPAGEPKDGDKVENKDPAAEPKDATMTGTGDDTQEKPKEAEKVDGSDPSAKPAEGDKMDVDEPTPKPTTDDKMDVDQPPANDAEAKEPAKEGEPSETATPAADKTADGSEATTPAAAPAESATEEAKEAPPKDNSEPTSETTATKPDASTPAAQPEETPAADAENSLLQGIHEYASQPPEQPPTPIHPPSAIGYMPSAPNLHTPRPTLQAAPKLPTPPPLPRERAQRCLVMLDQYPHMDPNMAPKKLPKNTSILEPRELAKVLIPSSYPTFTSEEAKYLLAKPKKRGIDPPVRERCAITSWPAKFRDPKTGLVYADMHTYKILQRVLAGGCSWSGLLGAWVGPAYGAMGRPAKGVPPGFAGAVDDAITGAAAVKTEGEQPAQPKK